LDDQIKEDKMGGVCSAYSERRNEYKILAGNPEGTKSLGRPRNRWENNIKMDFGEIGFEGCGFDSSGSE
jgi:hypothetical protein